MAGAEAIGHQSGRRVLGMGLACLAAFVAMLTLMLGWGMGFETFRRIRPDYPAMVPTTASALVAASLGTLALYGRRPAWLPLAAAGAIAFFVGLAHFSPLLPQEFRAGDGMSHASTLAALMAAASLVLRSRHQTGAASALDLAAIGMLTICLLGYVFDASALFNNPVFTKMALHTALSFLAVFLALSISDESKGWIGVVLAPEFGSQMARRVLPVVVAMPLILGLLAAIAVEQEVMTVEFRLAILVFLIIGSTSAAVIGFAHLTNVAERHGNAAQAAYLRSERRRQEVELGAARAQKVEALGQLVGGVAHDFNNTLSVILGNLELIEEDPDPAARSSYVGEAISASKRAATLTSQLLAYGRKSRLAPANVRAEKAVAPALAMFRRVCPANIEVVHTVDETAGIIRVDEDALQQALLNILINARDAMPEGGRIHVSNSLEPLAGAEVAGFGGPEQLPPGIYATIAVRDTGTGMTSEVAARASEPFFTTKGVGEGSGLGLSTVAGFCRQSGGGLRIESIPGAGSVVTLAFPQAENGKENGSSDMPEADEIDFVPRGILIVDDDDAVTRVMARQLRIDGHDVRVARDAAEALEVLAKGPLPEVVIADIIMPGRMQGHQLAERIRQRYPGLRVILMSGYDSAARREDIAALVDLPFLQKPISLSVLRSVVGSGRAREPSDPGLREPGE